MKRALKTQKPKPGSTSQKAAAKPATRSESSECDVETSAQGADCLADARRRRGLPECARIAEFLLAEIEELKTTKRELAERSGLSDDTVTNATSGRDRITSQTFQLLVRGLNKMWRNKNPSHPPIDAIEQWDRLRGTASDDLGRLPGGSAAQEIAYEIWCELSTRKIALALDYEHDVVAEVYDSWYACFGIVRESMKSLPMHIEAQQEAALRVMSVCQEILNVGMRPHLTRWSAEFRRWLSENADSAKFRGQRPQKIERSFPHYDALRIDLDAANERLIGCQARLHEMLFGGKSL